MALATQALQSLYKWWSWVDLDLFYGKVNFGHLYVWMGKTVIKSFNGRKLAAKDYIDWIILLMKEIDPRGVSAPAPGLYTCIWPPFSKIFSTETARPIKVKFYVEPPPWEGGTKVFINGPGHMTKMAAMPIYGKNFWKSSSPELEVLWSWNLACSIRDSSSTKSI